MLSSLSVSAERMENGGWRLALGGARTLGKLDESSTGARLSAQMRGRVLVFRLLSASSSRVAEVGQFVHEACACTLRPVRVIISLFVACGVEGESGI